MPRPNLPACDGRCCRNPYRICYHRHDCAHHQVDDAAQKLRDELEAAAEISRYDRKATRAVVR